MKKLYILGAAFLYCTAVFAQETTSEPYILPEGYGSKISRNGNVIAGQLISGSTFSRNNETGLEKVYFECFLGNGNCISDNGIIVGSDMNSGKAIFMKDGVITRIPVLEKFIMSDFYGITRDETRVCGIVMNPNLNNTDYTDPDFEGMMYIPVYCDISSDGEVQEPVFLPHPDKDFFGLTPQYCTAVWISDDGKTIAGQVIDDTGFYIYPIVYKEAEDGQWSYSLPSESLFNPDNLPIPRFPKADYYVPDIYDFISSPEKREEFTQDYEAWTESGDDPDMNPFDNLQLYMSQEEEDAYWEAYYTYLQESQEYNEKVDQYYNELFKFTQTCAFFSQNIMALKPDGSTLATSRTHSILVEGSLFPIYFCTPYVFNLEDNTYTVVNASYSSLNTNQVLPDGTIVAASPAGGMYSADATPPHSYVMLPGQDDFIPIQDYIQVLNPTYAQWMYDNLFHSVIIGQSVEGGFIEKEMVVSGLVSVSDDFSVISGGVDGYSFDYTDNAMYFTYIFTDVKGAGVESVATQDENGMFRVWNLQGVNVLNTTDSSEINSLMPGIYIVNGKKVLVK